MADEGKVVDDPKNETPMLMVTRSFRARTLETTGLHRTWWGAQEWAKRVKSMHLIHTSAVANGDEKARAFDMTVQDKMRRDGFRPATEKRGA